MKKYYKFRMVLNSNIFKYKTDIFKYKTELSFLFYDQASSIEKCDYSTIKISWCSA